MANEKKSDKFVWKPGDLTVAKKVYKGKVVDHYPWEKPGKPEKKSEKK